MAASSTKTVTFQLPEGAPASSREGGGASLPKTPHPKLLQDQPQSLSPTVSPSPLPPPSSAVTAATISQRERPQSRSSSQKPHLEEKRIKTAPQRTRREAVCRQKLGKPSEVSLAVNAVRERTNSASRENVRRLKYSVSRLRESLLRVDEEVKLMARGRRVLEMAVQDVRRAISVNQQSVSMQQKKSRAAMDSTLHLLREESHILSRSKSQAEQCLRTVKTHLQSLDNIRRSLRTRISTLSQSLELDAQNFKVYNGGREFRSAYEAPTSRNGSRNTDETIMAVCREAGELVSRSRGTRAGIEGLIISIETQRTQAHKSVTSSVAQSVQEASSKKREMLLERGQVRLSQNSAHHQQHNKEIMLGRILGPISDRHRSVSEMEDRPLSRRRPESSQEERNHLRRTTDKLTKRLSASAVHVTEMEEADQSLSRQLRQHSMSSSLDTHTLRIRKMSLDNRWVQ